MRDTAKIFMNGRSQAVRLPAEYRFESSEVYIRKDARTGDVILSARPDGWHELFDMIAQGGVPDDFLSDHDRQQNGHDRDPFAGSNT